MKASIPEDTSGEGLDDEHPEKRKSRRDAFETRDMEFMIAWIQSTKKTKVASFGIVYLCFSLCKASAGMKNGIFVLFFLLFLGTLSAQQEKGTEGYRIDLDAGAPEAFDILSPHLKDKKVFFSGEDHRFQKSNARFKLQLLKYLHQNAGVNVFMVEYGHGPAWLINRYLHTGDTVIASFFEHYSTPEAELYRSLREYNSTLPEEDRISVAGIDLEKSPEVAVMVLARLIPDNGELPPQEIRLELETLEALDRYHQDLRKEEQEREMFRGWGMFGYSTRHSLELVADDFQEHEGLYEQYLGKGFTDFKKIIKGFEAGAHYFELEQERAMQAGIFREEYLYDQFQELLEERPKQKFFGQFGRCHISLNKLENGCNRYVFNTLVSRIDHSEDPLVKGKVCSIATFYPNGPTFQEINTVNPEGLSYLEALPGREGNGLYMFDVAADDSLSYFLGDRFQYIVINRRTLEKETVEEKIPGRRDDEPFFFHIGGTGGGWSTDLSPLNDHFGSVGKRGFDPYRIMIGGKITFYQNQGISFSYHYMSMFSEERDLSDRTGLTLDGWLLGAGLGGDLLGSEHFFLGPQLIMEYGQYDLLYKEDLPSAGFQQAFFYDDQKQTHYRNPAFMLTPALDFKMNIGMIGIGLQGGYRWDVSDHRWRQGGSLLRKSTRTSLSGFWAGASVTLSNRLE